MSSSMALQLAISHAYLDGLQALDPVGWCLAECSQYTDDVTDPTVHKHEHMNQTSISMYVNPALTA